MLKLAGIIGGTVLCCVGHPFIGVVLIVVAVVIL